MWEAITSLEAAEEAYRVYIGILPWTKTHIAEFRVGEDGEVITAYDEEYANEIRVTTPAFTPTGLVDVELVDMHDPEVTAVLFDAIEVVPESEGEGEGEEYSPMGGFGGGGGVGGGLFGPLEQEEEEGGGVETMSMGGNWVDFSYTGAAEDGAFETPFNTMAEGQAGVAAGGTVNVVTGVTAETLVLNKPLRWESHGGTARIGVTGATNLPLQLNITLSGSGSVGKSPNASGYSPGTTVWLSPQPTQGWHFRNWAGDATGAGQPFPVLMDRHRRVTAVFNSGAYTSPVIISEIYAAGTGQSHGWHAELEANPWIELYNRSGASVNLAGWTLSTDVTQPDMYTLPSINLAAGARTVIVASGTGQSPPTTQYHHANFTFSRYGSYLALYTNDSPPRLASEFTPAFPELAHGWSYAYFPGSGSYQQTNQPAPGAADGVGSAKAVLQVVPTNVNFGNVPVQ